jgi:hypothetical protein
VKELRVSERSYDGFIVNVPKSHTLKLDDEERPKWLPKYLKLADGNSYSRERGFVAE